MKTQRKRALGLVLCFLVLVTSIFADKTLYRADETTDAGVVDGVSWEIKDATLTISAEEGASGKLKDYAKADGKAAPWMSSEAINSVENIVVADSITELGTGIYELDKNLKSLKIAGSVKEIPESFITAGNIDHVEILDGVEAIRSGAFWARVLEVTIPESVDTIGLYAFSGNRDVAETYLTKANVYEGSAADNYISTYNAYVSATRNNGVAADGLVYKRLVWSDTLNDYSDNGSIQISYIDDAKSPKAYYEVRIDQKAITYLTSTSAVEEKVRYAEYIKNDKALEATADKFEMLYSANSLVPFNLTIQKSGAALENEKCTIKVEIPEKWESEKEKVKIITLTEYGDEEIPTVVESELTTENDNSYLTFETNGSGAFAVLYDGDVEDEEDTENTEDTESTEDTEGTEDTENTEDTESTEDTEDTEDLDDTPETGMGVEPLLILSLCLALAGTGILLIAKNKQ